jgi:multicomponent K+:H+ antiporter subunit A
VLAGGVLRAAVPWAPAAGLAVSLRLDALAWLFALLVAGVGLLVVLYAPTTSTPTTGSAASTGCCSPSWARCSAW